MITLIAPPVVLRPNSVRSAKNFDPLDVEQAQVVCILATEIDIVDIGADRRIERRDRFGVAQAT
jgi:hypothetical protein